LRVEAAGGATSLYSSRRSDGLQWPLAKKFCVVWTAITQVLVIIGQAKNYATDFRICKQNGP
ncbi:hypothetical protein, partial [Escherichia coli]|uniref:hypothetical protein n=1 Tax=Escherichia coli TaxID=562 RepID=UPI003CE9A606